TSCRKRVQPCPRVPKLSAWPGLLSAGGRLLLGALNLLAVEADIVPLRGIVERTDADLPPGKGLVFGSHGRFVHIIEVYGDRAAVCIANDFYLVPVVSVRGAFVRIFGNLRARCVVNDENLVRVVDGLLSQVIVIEVCRALEAEEQAGIAVAVVGNGAFYLGR